MVSAVQQPQHVVDLLEVDRVVGTCSGSTQSRPPSSCTQREPLIDRENILLITAASSSDVGVASAAGVAAKCVEMMPLQCVFVSSYVLHRQPLLRLNLGVLCDWRLLRAALSPLTLFARRPLLDARVALRDLIGISEPVGSCTVRGLCSCMSDGCV